MTEFVFAMDHRIPVLPLIQECGLDTEFNRICGDMQYLYKTASDIDPTVLPYEKKLEKFLFSVLLGDELAAQVREALEPIRNSKINIARDVMLHCSIGLGKICYMEDNLPEAKQWWQKSLELSKALCRDESDAESYDRLAVLCYTIGTIDDNDVPMLEKAESLWEQLAQLVPQEFRYSQNAQIVHDILVEIGGEK